jgi:AraC-like DNA-binding protein
MKSVFGLNSKQWLMQRKIDRAQRLLSSAEIPIADIALETGYADQSAFSRQFRKATGLTPGQYRANHSR